MESTCCLNSYYSAIRISISHILRLTDYDVLLILACLRKFLLWVRVLCLNLGLGRVHCLQLNLVLGLVHLTHRLRHSHLCGCRRDWAWLNWNRLINNLGAHLDWLLNHLRVHLHRLHHHLGMRLHRRHHHLGVSLHRRHHHLGVSLHRRHHHLGVCLHRRHHHLGIWLHRRHHHLLIHFRFLFFWIRLTRILMDWQLIRIRQSINMNRDAHRNTFAIDTQLIMLKVSHKFIPNDEQLSIVRLR